MTPMRPHLWPLSPRKTLFALPPAPRKEASVFAVTALARATTRRPKSPPRAVSIPSVDAEVSTLMTRQLSLFDFDEPTPADTDAPLRQMSLRDVPPPPTRRDRALPLEVQAARRWLGEQHERGKGAGKQADLLARVLRKMTLDSVIYAGEWRLELVATEKGYPHYRLFWTVYTVGAVDIPVDWRHEQPIEACPDLPRIQAELARYLILCGFTAEGAKKTMMGGMATTPYETSKRGLVRLFKVRGVASDEEDEG